MSRKRLEPVASTGHCLVARPESRRLVVPHLCAWGQEHVAIAKRSLLELERRTPCGLDVRLALCWTSPDTVRYWRHVGKGPVSFRTGRKVLYAVQDVENWLASHRTAGR